MLTTVNCPNCDKLLINTDLPQFKYCPLKLKLIRFGEQNNRKARWEKEEGSGCGKLFAVPYREKVFNKKLNRWEIW